MARWPVVPLRRVAQFAYGQSLEERDREPGEVPVYGSNGQVGNHSSANTNGPVIIIGRKGSFGKVQFSERPVFAIDTTFFVDSRYTRVSLRWLYYVLTALKLDRLSEDVGVPGLSREKAYAESVPYVGLEEQRAIAVYLDQETARIAELTRMNQTLIDLLEKRKAAVRESEIQKLLSGPLEPLGQALREIDNRLGEAEPPVLLSVSIHKGVVPFEEANPDRVPRADELANYKVCLQDDIVLNRMRAFQGGLGRAPSSGIVSPDYAVLRPRSGVSAEYLEHLMRSPWFVGQMEKWLRGIGTSDLGNVRTPRVNWEDLRRILVPIPTAESQTQISHSITTQLRCTIDAQEALTRCVVLLAERRQALITANSDGNVTMAEAVVT
jgi:type I restriction enzyme S subunit